MAKNLRVFLFNTYGGFHDKRVKDLTKNLSFKIDDRGEHDVAYDFCDISVSVPDALNDTFKLVLQNCPHNAAVQELVKDHGGAITSGPAPGAISVCLQLRVKDSPFINKLSAAIRHVIGRGQKYNVPNWKWLASRTAKSLKELATNLREFKKQAP